MYGLKNGEKSTPMMTHLDELFSLPFLDKISPLFPQWWNGISLSKNSKFECPGAFISNAKNGQLKPRSFTLSRSRPLRTLNSRTTRWSRKITWQFLLGIFLLFLSSFSFCTQITPVRNRVFFCELFKKKFKRKKDRKYRRISGARKGRGTKKNILSFVTCLQEKEGRREKNTISPPIRFEFQSKLLFFATEWGEGGGGNAQGD